MKDIDLNLLLYAVNANSPRHQSAHAWLERSLSSNELIGLPWVVLLGFLRISTNRRIYPNPLETEQAIGVVHCWLSLPNTRILTPGEGHWPILRSLLMETGTAANLTTDAHLATLAIETSSELLTTDTDFARFPHLRWSNPLT